jgi:hypothetical protein
MKSILFYPEICTEIEEKKISSTTELIEISATVFQKIIVIPQRYFSYSQNKITTVV